jgi:hypothetical protein
MTELGTLVRQDPRQVWPDEASHFTPWLADHLDRLGEALGMELELIQRESGAGDFSIDILAHDLGQKRNVVIENQLETTDHRHLGQAITYAAAADAGVVVWVCREFRDEHRAALDWLNHGLSATTEFYGVVVEVLQIDDSRPAVNFRLVASPAGRSLRRVSPTEAGEPSERGLLYQNFFQRLLDQLREKHKFTNARAAQPQNWYSFSSGVPGFSYSAAFKRAGRLGIELYIDFRDEDQNLAALHALQNDAAEIEKNLGEKLSWEELEDRRSCRIAIYRDGSIRDPQDRVDEYLEWTIQKLLALRAAFGPRIRKIADSVAGASASA